jgi:hypothetical protein
VEHHGLHLRSDGTIDSDYYVSQARARRRESERLIDETALYTKRRIALDSLAHIFRRLRLAAERTESIVEAARET